MQSMDLVHELNETSDLLDTTLDRYTRTCAAISDHCDSQSTGSTTQMVMDNSISKLSTFSSYKRKLQQIKIALRRIRNKSPRLIPINTLPFEILAHIFWLSSDFGCIQRRGYSHEPIPYDPVLQVCSRWRQIALASPALWSHIDMLLSNRPSRNDRQIMRANMLATQSKQMPLELHIWTTLAYPIEGLATLCQSIAPRLKSLKLYTEDRPGSSFHDDQLWLNALFSNATAGNITRLDWEAARCPGVDASFLVANDPTTIYHPCTRISVSKRQLEDFLLRITSLRLVNIYPPWTSHAYHGLVDLSLLGSDDCESGIAIKELELVSILKASPGLQYLRIGLTVRLEKAINRPPPVQLTELKQLELTSYSPFPKDPLFRMVCPGQASLQVTITYTRQNQSHIPSPSWVELSSFVTRSNITQLCFRKQFGGGGWDLPFNACQVFELLPRLEFLEVRWLLFGQPFEPPHNIDYSAMPEIYMPSHDYLHPIKPWRLRILRLIECCIGWNDLLATLEVYPVQKIVVDRCIVEARYGKRSELEAAIRCLSPDVELSKTWGKYRYEYD